MSSTLISHPYVVVNGVQASFGVCMLSCVDADVVQAPPDHEPYWVTVSDEARGNVSHITLESVKAKQDDSYALQHAPHCPCKERARDAKDSKPSTGILSCFSVSASPSPAPTKLLRVGVCMLVYNDKHECLITRRASHMRSFPSAWVFPGGRLDPGERLEQAGMREVWEETGIHVDASTVKPLCLWESCYPIRAAMGPTKAHYLVMFYTAKVRTIEAACNPDEVDMSAWLGINDLRFIVQTTNLKPDANAATPKALNTASKEELAEALKGSPVISAQHWKRKDPADEKKAQADKPKHKKAAASEDLTPHPHHEPPTKDVVDLSTAPLSISEVAGMYPNKFGSGIARGHYFAIEQFLKRHEYC